MSVDAFLMITDQKGDIKAESSDKNHPKHLQIRNYSFGVKNEATASTGSGLGAGKADMEQFEFDMDNSTASPTIFQHCCDGTHCKSAVLYIRKSGGDDPKDYYIWKFKDLVITEFKVTIGSNGEIEEHIAFAFTAVHCDYKMQKPDGSLDSALQGGWDVKQNGTWGGA